MERIITGDAGACGFQPKAILFFQNGDKNLFGSSWVGSALEYHQLSRTQIRRNGMRGVLDVAQIRFVMIGKWRGDADDDRVQLRKLGVVRCGRESRRLCGGYVLGKNAVYVRSAAVQRAYFLLIDVKTGYAKPLLTEK